MFNHVDRKVIYQTHANTSKILADIVDILNTLDSIVQVLRDIAALLAEPKLDHITVTLKEDSSCSSPLH